VPPQPWQQLVADRPPRRDLLDGQRWAKRYELARVVVLVAFSVWFWKSGRLA